MSNSYVCNKEIFKHIYKMEKQRSSRQKNYSYLSHIKLEEKRKNNIKKASQGIEKILSTKLRSGDVVCKLNNNHFVLIVNNVDDNGINVAMKRVKKHFLKSINDSNIDLIVNYLPIT